MMEKYRKSFSPLPKYSKYCGESRIQIGIYCYIVLHSHSFLKTLEEVLLALPNLVLRILVFLSDNRWSSKTVSCTFEMNSSVDSLFRRPSYPWFLSMVRRSNEKGGERRWFFPEPGIVSWTQDRIFSEINRWLEVTSDFAHFFFRIISSSFLSGSLLFITRNT